MLFLYGLAPDALVNAYLGRIVLHHWPILQPYAGHVRKYYGYVEFLQHLEGWHKVLKDVDLARKGGDGRAVLWTDARGIVRAKTRAVREVQRRFP